MKLFRSIAKSFCAVFLGGRVLGKQTRKFNALQQEGLRLADAAERLVLAFPAEVGISSGNALTEVQKFRLNFMVDVPLRNYKERKSPAGKQAILNLAVGNLKGISRDAAVVKLRITSMSSDVPHIKKIRAQFEVFIRSIRNLKLEFEKLKKKPMPQPQLIGSTQ